MDFAENAVIRLDGPASEGPSLRIPPRSPLPPKENHERCRDR